MVKQPTEEKIRPTDVLRVTRSDGESFLLIVTAVAEGVFTGVKERKGYERVTVIPEWDGSHVEKIQGW